MSVRSRAFHGGFSSSSNVSATSAGGEVGGPGHVAVCCNGVPSGGGSALLLTHSGTFETRTLRRWPVPDRFWNRFDWRPFEIHPCTLVSVHTTTKRHWHRAPPRKKGSATREDSTGNAKTEPQGNHTQRQQERTETHHNHSQHHPPPDRKSIPNSHHMDREKEGDQKKFTLHLDLSTLSPPPLAALFPLFTCSSLFVPHFLLRLCLSSTNCCESSLLSVPDLVLSD